jgi:predicted RNA-binding protein with PUA-like domain
VSVRRAAKPAPKPAAKNSARKPDKPAASKSRAKSAAKASKAAASARAKPAPGVRFWLVKSEPTSYSIADLKRDGVTAWTGVRNYQARNTLRDLMQPGDRVLFYHSSTEPMAVVGVCEVASAPRPDPTAFDRKDDHYDPDSDPANPAWWLVDLRHVESFAQPVPRERLAQEPALRSMVLLQRGSRLSVQPVTPVEFATVLALARAGAR